MDDEETQAAGSAYEIASTSNQSAVVRDIPLSETPTGLARKVLRAQIVSNRAQPSNTVKLTLVHQKRTSVNEDWEDLSGPTLVGTRVNLPSKFALKSSETKSLFDHLADLYEIGDDGIPSGRVVVQLTDQDRVIQTDSARAQLIRRLLDADHGEEFWRLLVELHPNVESRLREALIIQQRRTAISEFEVALPAGRPERYWQELLESNTWMLGGANVRLVPEARLDIGNTTDLPFEVDGGFMDIVELKKPSFPFWARKRDGSNLLYRDKYLVPSVELEGAISQLSGYIFEAERQVDSTTFRNRHGVTPLKPTGLVVHGRSSEWSEAEWHAFRLLNDRLSGVQVITFDHLLMQAQRAVDLGEN